MEEKLVDLETRIAFQEEAIHQLDSLAVCQQRQIEQLEKQVELLLDNIRSLQGQLNENLPPSQ